MKTRDLLKSTTRSEDHRSFSCGEFDIFWAIIFNGLGYDDSFCIDGVSNEKESVFDIVYDFSNVGVEIINSEVVFRED